MAAQDALPTAPAPFLEPGPAESLGAAAPATSDAPTTLKDCARAFSEIVAPAEGPGAPTVREATRGVGWLGPDPRARIALNSGTVPQVPEGWAGPEETEMFEPST
eukprot:11480569-Alexandrium_andersonii.AAC.1